MLSLQAYSSSNAAPKTQQALRPAITATRDHITSLSSHIHETGLLFSLIPKRPYSADDTLS
jgi:hypothetical protein